MKSPQVCSRRAACLWQSQIENLTSKWKLGGEGFEPPTYWV